MPANPEVLKIYINRSGKAQESRSVVAHNGTRRLGVIYPHKAGIDHEELVQSLEDQGHEVKIASVGADQHRVVVLERIGEKVRLTQKTQPQE